jgi:TPR repeat protein
VEDRQAFTNEGLAIGISLDGAMGGEVALLTGLAAGTRLSLGSAFGANGWRLPARDLTQALAYAPKDFAGVMEGTVDVRTENDVLIDSRPIRLAWLPKQSEEPVREARLDPKLDPKEAVQPVAIPSLDAEELATLMRRGEEYLKTGDIAAARLVLRRAANAGHAQAALALGATFDPVILAELGVLGFPPDLAQARSWYDKAARLGLDEAQRRLERLARAGN